jgi:hypothetical protein
MIVGVLRRHKGMPQRHDEMDKVRPLGVYPSVNPWTVKRQFGQRRQARRCDMAEKKGIEWGMGWFPDYPDFRDFTQEKSEISRRLQMLDQKPIREMIDRVGILQSDELDLPSMKDLRQWCSPIENQSSLGSCTANAGGGGRCQGQAADVLLPRRLSPRFSRTGCSR